MLTKVLWFVVKVLALVVVLTIVGRFHTVDFWSFVTGVICVELLITMNRLFGHWYAGQDQNNDNNQKPSA